MKPRTVPMKSKKGVRRVNPKRKARRWKDAFHSKEFVLWTKRQPCRACGELTFDPDTGEGMNQASHSAKSRANGGTYKDVVSLCLGCHDLEHKGDKTFWREVGVSARRAANEHHERWLVECERRAG